MSKYKRTFGDDIDEKEELEIDDDLKVLTPEEETFKKRYGDLRSHSQKQFDVKDARITELESQLESASKKDIVFPKSESEIEEWATKYPDVAKIVETLAMRQANTVREDIDKRLDAISKKEATSAKRIARAELAKAHTDFFDEIRVSDEFHEWLDTKSKMIRDAVYENDTDYKAAIDVVTMYKSEKGLSKKTNTRKASRNNAEEVRPNSSNGTPSGNSVNGVVFKESDISRMSSKEYDANEKEIDLAAAEGRIVYDLSSNVN